MVARYGAGEGGTVLPARQRRGRLGWERLAGWEGLEGTHAIK